MISIEDADAILEFRVGAEEWFMMDSVQKDKYLKTANDCLNDIKFLGEPTLADEPFPRVGTVIYDGKLYDLESAEVLALFNKAVTLQALHLLKNPGILDDIPYADNVSTGDSFAVSKLHRPERVPLYIVNIIGFARNRSTQWWRAN